jgi:hypothetical protein
VVSAFPDHIRHPTKPIKSAKTESSHADETKPPIQEPNGANNIPAMEKTKPARKSTSPVRSLIAAPNPAVNPTTARLNPIAVLTGTPNP